MCPTVGGTAVAIVCLFEVYFIIHSLLLSFNVSESAGNSNSSELVTESG
jgi:hypothetical protein